MANLVEQVPEWRSAGITHPGQGDNGITRNIKFGRIYGSTRLDYIYFKDSGDHYEVRVWENTGGGGRKRKADGNFYCDMTGSGTDDYVWIYYDGKLDQVNLNIHSPPNVSLPGSAFIPLSASETLPK